MATDPPDGDDWEDGDALLGRSRQGAGWAVAGGVLAGAGWFWLNRIEVCGDSAVVFPAFALGVAAVIASWVGVSTAGRVAARLPSQERPTTAGSPRTSRDAGGSTMDTDPMVARLQGWTSITIVAGVLVIAAAVPLVLLALTGVASCGGPD